RGIQIRKRHRHSGYGINHICQLRCVPRLVLPGLEVTDLGPSDTEDYAQDFRVADSLRELGVETASALLDEGKVKASSVGDCLNKVRIVRVRVSSGNRRMLPDGQGGDGLSRGIAEV